MKSISLQVLAKQASSIKEFSDNHGRRRIGMVYFSLVPGGNLVARVISDATDAIRLEKMIEQGGIFLPAHITTATDKI